MAHSNQAAKTALEHLTDNSQLPIRLVEDASIRSQSGERVSINETRETPTEIHCVNENLASTDTMAGAALSTTHSAVCEDLACSTESAMHLSTISSERVEKDGEEAGDKIKIMETEERAKLLSTFGEREFNLFLEQSNDLEQLQSLQYLFTHRINNLKKASKRQSPRRPVIEQRKVGDYLYKLQATQKGDSYWYIQFTKEGKRCHKYLGKERPSFNPKKDLGQTES